MPHNPPHNTNPLSDAVRDHSPHSANQRIDQQLHYRLTYYRKHPAEINTRLQELDAEWNIERTLQANAATITLASLALGLTCNQKWLAMPALVSGFLLHHAIRGWCPPLPVFRRLGVRTQQEIEQERYALLSLQQKP